MKKSKDKDKGVGERERVSAVSARSLLPSLSPDSDHAMDPPEEIEDDDPFSTQPLPLNPSLSPTADDRKEKIPEDLLSVLLHQFFKQDGTRMSKDANRAVGRYMETFVREALARAAWARDGVGEGGGGDLEVEDLERLAPQLVLDF